MYYSFMNSKFLTFPHTLTWHRCGAAELASRLHAKKNFMKKKMKGNIVDTAFNDSWSLITFREWIKF